MLLLHNASNNLLGKGYTCIFLSEHEFVDIHSCNTLL